MMSGYNKISWIMKWFYVPDQSQQENNPEKQSHHQLIIRRIYCHDTFIPLSLWRIKLLYFSVYHTVQFNIYVRSFIVSYHNCCKWRHTIDTCGNNSFYLCKIRRRWLGLAQNLFEFYNLNNIVLWVAKLIFHLLRKTNLIFKYRMTKF